MARIRVAPLMPRRLVLASASPARLALLRAAGLDPEIVVSGVDEDVISAPPAELALQLAQLKARAVADRPESFGAVVIGCDSVLDLAGVALGKPRDAADATQRWQEMRGQTGHLLTGHCLIDGSTGVEVAELARTTVRFGTPSDAEIAAYVATGEPLAVAGAFTIDGLGGWFVESVDGAPSTVVGLSLPLLRTMFSQLNLAVTDFWTLTRT